ncbi:MAG: GGDEF domain-containing protein [Candidatus Eisenbacteria bacterium]|nr:GGDEF domain-containing protein [Candidatus Eisenbacteria bacterium]
MEPVSLWVGIDSVESGLKRIPVGYLELLRDLLPRRIMGQEMMNAASRAISGGSPVEIRETARQILRSLLAEGRLQIVARTAVEGGERIRILEPQSGLRISVVLDAPADGGGLDVIPLPVETGPAATLKASVVRQLLTDHGMLVLSDRVASPRDIILRLEPILGEMIETESVTFAPIEHPAGQIWGEGRPSALVLSATRLRDLARLRDHVISVSDFAALDPIFRASRKAGSAIYLGIGDDIAGWRSVVQAYDPRPRHFTPDRIALAALLCQHSQTLLASAVRLQSLIFLDYLTGLYNRPYFEDQIDKQVSIARRRRQSLALCIVDIDDFKNFNTLYGYQGGDRALVTVGCILRAMLRTSDTLARYGGEEFAALLVPPVSGETALAIAQRLRAAVEEEPFQVQDLKGAAVSERITVSIGVALFPDHGENAQALWAVANQMLLEAKRDGKNRVRFAGGPG